MATLINGNGNLAIYAHQDADWYAALMGGQTVITAVGNQFAYELLDANTIGIKDGVIITAEGRRIQLDANAIDSFDIPTGAQGTTNYYIIGYHLVTGDQSEQTAETFVQQMDNATDTIPEGSFRNDDDDVYISLYRVRQNDLIIGTISLLLPKIEDSLLNQIDDLNSNLNDYSVNTPLRNVTYYNGKLYQITSSGQKGSEIKMSYELDFANKYALSTTNYVTAKAGAVLGTLHSSNNENKLKINGEAIYREGTGGLYAPINIQYVPSGTTLSLSQDISSGMGAGVFFVPYK